MKNLLLMAAFLCCNFGFSQTLKTANLDLNSGGEIYDVIFDQYSNAFIVVGDFTSIQGVARQNLALIDATTFTVQSEAPITSINGAIRTVALKREFLFPSPNKNYLYIGGDFTQVNGVTRNYICQLQKPEPTSPPFNSSYNLMLSWDAGIFNSSNPNHHVNDFEFFNDTILAVGAFELYSGLTPYPLGYDYGGIMLFQANSSTIEFDSVRFNSYSMANINAEHYDIEYIDNEFFLAGEMGFQRFDYNGIYVNDFPICSSGASYVMNVHKTSEDTLLLTRVDYGTGEGIAIYELNGNMLNCPFNNQIPTIFMDGVVPADGFISTYENQVFVAENNQVLSYSRNGTDQLQPDQVTSVNNGWYSFVGSGWRPPKTTVVEGKLFLFGDNLNTVNGQSHTGLAAFCLPPNDAKEFTQSDTMVCEGETALYTIPQADFASGYKWTYSGSGAQYRVAGTGAPLQPLNSNYVNNTNANSLEVFFPSGATAGVLTVEPYSTCNTAVDYMFSSGRSLNIQVIALPDASMSDTTFFNCYSDSSWMVVSSAVAGADYYIYKGVDTTYNDSILFELGSLPPQFPLQTYYGVVTEPINGCTNLDSSVFVIDTVGVNLSGQFDASPSFFTCNTPSVEINCTASGTTSYWEYDGDPTTPLPNPFSIYSTDSLDFTLYTTKISNGCLSVDSITVQTDTSTTMGSIVGYATMNFPLDSISCNDPTLTLTCQATDGTASWLNNGVPTGNDQITITEADTVGLIGSIGIFQYATTSNQTGCEQIFEVAIHFDFDLPFVSTYQGNASLNCSDTTAEVVHQSSGNPIEGWLDPLGVQTSNDTLLASSSGEYYYQVQGANGCLNTDTVTVSQTLDMSVFTPSDTLVCPGESVSILAVPTINTGETPTFLWSNGSTGSSTTAIGGADSEVSVIVQTTSGCIGYDTTQILITDPIMAYFSSSAGCTSAAIQVDSIFGGNGDYEYSLDQTNWQTTPAFTGVGVGLIDIYVRDNLGCVYSFQQTISPAVSGLDVNFLMPTYNNLGDTIVALNFESFAGFDSLNWVLPAGAEIAFETDSLVAFTLSTEGWYDVTLIGYSDTCQYSTTHQVYFGAAAVFDTLNQSLGIQSVLAYPNPTNGFFTLEVELGEAQNYFIQVVSSQGQPIQGMQASGFSQSISEDFQFPVGSVSGSYIIHIVCDYDIEQETIILN